MKKTNNLPFPRMKRIGWAKFILLEDFSIEVNGIYFHIKASDKVYNGRSFIIRDGLMRPAWLLHDVVCEPKGKVSPLVCSKTVWTPLEAANLYYEVCELYGVPQWRKITDYSGIRTHDILFKHWDY